MVTAMVKSILFTLCFIASALFMQSALPASNNFLQVASDSSTTIYLDRQSVKYGDSGTPMFNVVMNTKNGMVISGKKAKSIVTGHFMDCNGGLIVTTWMEVFEGEFGKGKYISQVPDMYETQGKTPTNQKLFSALCK